MQKITGVLADAEWMSCDDAIIVGMMEGI